METLPMPCGQPFLSAPTHPWQRCAPGNLCYACASPPVELELIIEPTGEVKAEHADAAVAKQPEPAK